MHAVETKPAITVKVVKNSKNPRWAAIKVNGTRVHVGSPAYIRRLARQRYNINVNL
jgi:hypothetical protein